MGEKEKKGCGRKEAGRKKGRGKEETNGKKEKEENNWRMKNIRGRR